MPPGRPAISGEPKSNRLPILLTDAERERLDQAAARAGKPTSTWARDELLRLAESPGKKTAGKRK